MSMYAAWESSLFVCAVSLTGSRSTGGFGTGWRGHFTAICKQKHMLALSCVRVCERVSWMHSSPPIFFFFYPLILCPSKDSLWVLLILDSVCGGGGYLCVLISAHRPVFCSGSGILSAGIQNCLCQILVSRLIVGLLPVTFLCRFTIEYRLFLWLCEETLLFFSFFTPSRLDSWSSAWFYLQLWHVVSLLLHEVFTWNLRNFSQHDGIGLTKFSVDSTLVLHLQWPMIGY